MPLRSILLTGEAADGLDAALGSPADAVAVDLSTASDVDAGRRFAAGAIGRAAEAGKRAVAIVNHPRTQLLRDDIDAVVSTALHAVVINALEPQDVRDTAVLLREFELARGIEPGAIAIFPSIGTARALLRAADIAAAAPRVGGVVFAGDAYARDTNARPEEAGPRLSYARGIVVAAARAIDGTPLVAGTALQFRETARYGFAGAIVSDLARVTMANDAFSPSEGDLARARRDIEAYESARRAGAWVARDRGDVIDAHRARKARRLLSDPES